MILSFWDKFKQQKNKTKTKKSSKYCSPIHGFCGTLAGTNSLGLRLYCPEMIIIINVFLSRKILSEGTFLSAFKHTRTRTRRHILYTVHNLQPTQKQTYCTLYTIYNQLKNRRIVHCTQSTTNLKTDIYCTLYTIYNQLKNKHILYTVHNLQPTLIILYSVHNLQPTQKQTYIAHYTLSTTNSKTNIYCTLYTIYNQLKKRPQTETWGGERQQRRAENVAGLWQVYCFENKCYEVWFEYGQQYDIWACLQTFYRTFLKFAHGDQNNGDVN